MTDSKNMDLALAMTLADRADAIALERFRSLDLVVDTKPDLTPVSDADRAVEAALRAILSKQRPDDAILGEEFGTTGSADRRWVLDPIDGTKNYVRGVPAWATLIALATGVGPAATAHPIGDGTLTMGLVSAPALGMRWWASSGEGAWAQPQGGTPRPISVSSVADISDASVSYSDWNDPAWDTTSARKGFQQLLETAWRSRAFGDFWSHMLVAEGAMDVAIEPQLSPWDMAALIPIVTEAGGQISALNGQPPLAGGNAVSTNGKLHTHVLEMLAANSLPET